MRDRWWPRRVVRRFAVIFVVPVVVLVLLFYIGGGWFFSGQLYNDALSGEKRRAALVPEYDLTVLAAESDTVTLQVGDDPPSALTTGERWGLRWDRGWGQVAEIVGSTETEVIRRFRQVSGRPLEAGSAASLTSWVYHDDPKTGLDLEYRDITFGGELGDYPAWFVEGTDDTWVIIVHGNGMTRLDGLRILEITEKAGHPTLLITFRNDPGAPEDPSGLLQYGVTEWRDVESAVQFALDRGARDVVLAAYSMGGGSAVNFLYQSPLVDRVTGVILDSPMLDFGRTVDHGASQRTIPGLGIRVPKSLTAVAKSISSLRFGIDWSELNYLDRADQLNTPMLIIHGTEDLVAPIITSEQLANQRPDLVQLLSTPGAGHVQSWNFDRVAYTDAVQEFLNEVG